MILTNLLGTTAHDRTVVHCLAAAPLAYVLFTNLLLLDIRKCVTWLSCCYLFVKKKFVQAMLVFHSAAETAGVEICVVDDAFIVFYA